MKKQLQSSLCQKFLLALCIGISGIWGSFFNTSPLLAQVTPPTVPQTKLKVGFAGESPVVIKSETGQITGITVEMWRLLADELKLKYEIIFYPSVSDALTHLSLGKIDVAFGTVSVNPERLELFDFTQPITQNELTLLLAPEPPTLFSIIKPFLGWAFLSSVGIIYFCLFVVGNLLWLAEHRKNSEQFPAKYHKGIAEGMWCALATMTTVGYGDRYPKTRLGRFILGWWGIISIVGVTSLTAGIATTLSLAFSRTTVEQFKSPKDLENARIAVIIDSNSQKWAEHYHAQIVPIKNLNAGIAQLKEKQVDAILYSRLLLKNYLHHNRQIPYRIANFIVGTENLSIALKRQNPLTQKLNEHIMMIDTQIKFRQIAENWLAYSNENPNPP